MKTALKDEKTKKLSIRLEKLITPIIKKLARQDRQSEIIKSDVPRADNYPPGGLLPDRPVTLRGKRRAAKRAGN